jgi:hypothetical protein
MGAVITLTSACATTGATFRSGVGDSFPLHPPYYAGKAVPNGAVVGFFPITFQRGATQPEDFDPKSSAGTPLGMLVADMNRYLDSLGVGKPLAENATMPGTAPNVDFGCIRTTSPFDCDPLDNQQALGRGDQRNLRLAVGRPSDDWSKWAAEQMAGSAVPNALLINLEISDYYIRQTGLVGRKEVELGTGYTISVPWLTGLDTPVNVLQLTGALVNPDGTAKRIGAEGLVARRTGMVVGALAAQRVITDDDIAQLRNARRGDLPGGPLVWQVALRNLDAQLAGRPELAMR